MPQTESISRHPLFDPASLFSRIQGHKGADRMRGYIACLWGRAEHEHYPTPDASARSVAERHRLACLLEGLPADSEPSIQVLDALAVPARVLFAGEPSSRSLLAHTEFCLVREANASHTIGMLFWFDPSAHAVCSVLRPSARFVGRVFLFEPEALLRMEGFLAGRPLLDAFDAEVMTQNLGVTQMLASCPGFQAEWSPADDALRFGRLAVWERYCLLPPRAKPPRIVVVFHPA